MKDYSSYVALIVATETEEKAIKNMYDWKPVTFSDDTQTYYSSSNEKTEAPVKLCMRVKARWADRCRHADNETD